MNPVAVVIGLLGVLLLIVAFKGKQDDLIAGVLGKKYNNSTLQ